MRWPPPSAPKKSLRRRLSIGLVLGLAVLWLAGIVAAGFMLRSEIDEVFDSALQEVAQRVLPLAYFEVLNRDTPDSANIPSLRVPPASPQQEYITYVVRDARGRVLLQSHDADLAAFPDRLQPGFHTNRQLRLYTERAVQGTFFVTTAEPLSHRRAAVLDALRMLAWPLALLLPISAFGIWAFVGYTLHPVLSLQREIETRGQSNLSPVITSGLPAEIEPLAGAVNHLIIRLRRALEAERSFTANSAHELRTPIAAALAQSQRLLAEMPDGASRKRAHSIEVALRQLSQLSEKLLQLAKAEGGSLLTETPQDLSQLLQLVLDDLSRNPGNAERLAIDLPNRRAVWSLIDADAFAILARNLIENALKHSPVESPVNVKLTNEGCLSVVNQGPPFAPEELARLKRPFQRSATPAKGSGLGLAIADTIARGVGAQLELLSPIPGQMHGFEARVYLADTETHKS